jgi:hypothetical protein
MSDQDQIVDAVMAQAIQADAARTHPLVAWIVMHDEGTYRGQFVARLLTAAPTPYVLAFHASPHSLTAFHTGAEDLCVPQSCLPSC